MMEKLWGIYTISSKAYFLYWSHLWKNSQDVITILTVYSINDYTLPASL